MMLIKITAARQTSGFDLSIGTSHAVEALFDPKNPTYDDKREFKRLENLTLYSKHYFNVYTLLRNMFSSMDTEINEKLFGSKESIDVLVDTLIEEMYNLKDIYLESGITPVLMIPDYAKVLKNLLPKEKRIPPTKVEVMFNLSVKAIKELLTKRKNDIPIEVFSSQHILPDEKGMLLTSHITLDKLAVSRVNNLVLIESNTGGILHNKEFSKKFSFGNRDLSFFPYTEILEYLYGNGVNTKSFPVRLKRDMYNAVLERKGATTLSSSISRPILKAHGIKFNALFKR